MMPARPVSVKDVEAQLGDRATQGSHEEKTLSELAHCDSRFFLGLNSRSFLGQWECKVHPAISLKWQSPGI
jgi:hypothetical protein